MYVFYEFDRVPRTYCRWRRPATKSTACPSSYGFSPTQDPQRTSIIPRTCELLPKVYCEFLENCIAFDRRYSKQYARQSETNRMDATNANGVWSIERSFDISTMSSFTGPGRRIRSYYGRLGRRKGSWSGTNAGWSSCGIWVNEAEYASA